MANTFVWVENLDSDARTAFWPLTFLAPITGDSGFFALNAWYKFEIIGVVTYCDSGTATVEVTNNGTAVAGLSSISVSNTRTATTITPVTIETGRIVRVNFTADSSCVCACVQLLVRRLS